MNQPAGVILVAEDEESDAFILRRAFQRAGIAHRVIVAEDGQAAVDYLTGMPPYHDRAAHPLPALLTLDLKMPRRNGFEVLTWLREHPEFKDMPVVVISSSSNEADVQEARELGARDYFVKPVGLDDFLPLVRRLSERWLTKE